ncbi:hypothetical protein AN958_09645 [Leucoagaricus sp. SymC.cos]|nr:hypothetical protein AN958_09645 [Leucoagaricus sp. SymC.cos]
MAISYPAPKPIELVFSGIDEVSMAMDVYIPEQATKDEHAPVLLWWHGESNQAMVITGIIAHSEMAMFVDPNSEKASWAEATGKRSMSYYYHGKKGTKVPYQLSLDVVAANKSVGSSVEYHDIDGVDHCFDDAELELIWWVGCGGTYDDG